MQRFKSLVAVLTEDSLHEVALERAVHLAKQNNAALTVVDVVEANPGELARLLSALQGQRGAEIEEDVIAYHRARIAGYADQARAQGVEVTEAVLQGSTFVEVIRMVLREGHDMVIKGATKDGDGNGVLKGADMHLLRKCPCPVWMLKGAGDGNFDTILATVDPEPHGDDARDRLDRLVLDLATSMAERDKATCHVAHAWRLQEEYALRHGRYTSKYQGEVDRMVEREKDQARARLDGLLADYPEIEARHVHLVKGLPGDAIAEYADQLNPDLIVMGTVGRTGISGFIMGNTAETILHRVNSALIAVKPEGFVSPVTLDSAV